MKLPRPVKEQGVFVLRLAAAFVLLYPLLTWAAGGYGEGMAFVFQRQIELLRPNYNIRKLKYVSSGPRKGTIQLDLKVVVDPKDRKAGARNVGGHYPAEILILQPLIVLSVLCSWPVTSWRKRILPLLFGVCGLVLAFLIDLPFQLIQVIESSLNEYGNQGYWLKKWVDFLSGGGRLLITVIVIFAAAIPYRPSRRLRNEAPCGMPKGVGAEQFHKKAKPSFLKRWLYPG